MAKLVRCDGCGATASDDADDPRAQLGWVRIEQIGRIRRVLSDHALHGEYCATCAERMLAALPTPGATQRLPPPPA